MIRLSRISPKQFLPSSRGYMALVAAAFLILLPSGGLLAQEEEFTIVLLPDTQYYYGNELPDENNTSGIYEDQACWIVKKKAEGENIQFVIHLGDITDIASVSQFETAHEAHGVLRNPDVEWANTQCGTKPLFPPADPPFLAGSVRFSVLPGNHDGPMDFVNYNELDHFGPDAFDCFMHGPDCSSLNQYTYGGSIEPSMDPPDPPEDAGRNEANWQTFEAGDQEFLVLSLPARQRGRDGDYYDAPSKDDLCWASDIVQQHPDRHVIVATHGYLGERSFDAWEDSCPRKTASLITGADAMCEEFVSRHGNIFMVLSGHVGDSEHRVRRHDIDGDGAIDQSVHEILTDYQFEDPMPPGSGSICYVDNDCDIPSNPIDRKHCHGGNGWLRLLRLNPSEGHVYASIETTIDQDVDGDDDHRWYDQMFPKGSSSSSHALNHCGYYRDSLLDPGGYAPYHSKPDHPNHQFDFPYDFTLVRVCTGGSNDGVACQGDNDCSGGGICETLRDLTSHTFRDRWVNETYSGDQKDSAVATDADGNFVVVWVDESAGASNAKIRMRGFDRYGCERFPEVLVDDTTGAGAQREPALAMDSNGNFVVVWREEGTGIWLRAIAGTYAIPTDPLDDHATVRTKPYGDSPVNYGEPDVAINDAGKVVVVWQEDRPSSGADYEDIRGMAYDFDTSNLLLNPWWATDAELIEYVTYRQRSASVAIAVDGDFVVTYEDDQDGNGQYQIHAAGWDVGSLQNSSPTKLFSIISVNEYPAGDQLNPVIAMAAEDLSGDGRFVIAWRDDQDDNDMYNVAMRGFESDGTEWFAQEDVAGEGGDENYPAIAMVEGAETGLFVVSWQQDLGLDGAHNVHASGYSYNTTDGTKEQDFDKFMVHWDDDGDQRSADGRIAMASDGDVVAVWSDDRDGNGSWETMARGLEWADLLDEEVEQGEDEDGDGVFDGWDNCPDAKNPKHTADTDCNGDGDTKDPGEKEGQQCDLDSDGIGDACDPCPYSATDRDCVATAHEKLQFESSLNDSLSTGNVEVSVSQHYLWQPDVDGPQDPRSVCVIISEHTPRTDAGTLLGQGAAVVEATVEADYRGVDVTLYWNDADMPAGYPEELLVTTREHPAIGWSGSYCQDDPACEPANNKWEFAGGGQGTYSLVALDGAGSVNHTLTVDKDPGGTELQLSWATSCWSPDGGYGIYRGTLGSFDSHVPVAGFCDVASTQANVAVPAGSTYYLVVPQSGWGPYEGSYGTRGDGALRSPSAAPCNSNVQKIVVCPD